MIWNVKNLLVILSLPLFGCANNKGVERVKSILNKQGLLTEQNEGSFVGRRINPNLNKHIIKNKGTGKLLEKLIASPFPFRYSLRNHATTTLHCPLAGAEYS